MVVLEKTKLIVMLTELKSETDFQCYQYYPTMQKDIQFDNYVVKLESEETLKNGIVKRVINI